MLARLLADRVELLAKFGNERRVILCIFGTVDVGGQIARWIAREARRRRVLPVDVDTVKYIGSPTIIDKRGYRGCGFARYLRKDWNIALNEEVNTGTDERC